MKFKRYIILMLTLSLLVFGAVSVSAYSGSYSFDIAAYVSGTKIHSLNTDTTTTTANADSFNWDYTISSTKYAFTVQLYKSWLNKYDAPQITADGNNHTKSFGVIPSGDYTINVTKNTGSGGYVIGSGTINQ